MHDHLAATTSREAFRQLAKEHRVVPATRKVLADSETLLRRAASRPDAGAQERQNLALVLGLEGKMAEAEHLIRQDLPPDVAAANLAYLRGASGLPTGAVAADARNWGSLQGAQVAK